MEISTSIALRHIVCCDALEWLAGQPYLENVVTGIPDAYEIKNNDTCDYIDFFQTAATRILSRMVPDGYAIFVQTDRKKNKTWISKSTILITTASTLGFKLVWHKIILNRDLGATDLFRPTYAHMLCFTKTGSSGAATPDVLPVSTRIYANATPIDAVIHAVDFIKKYSKHQHEIVDPFIGRGTVAVVANKYGFAVRGVDNDPEQVQKALLADFALPEKQGQKTRLKLPKAPKPSKALNRPKDPKKKIKL
jgi:hypothetical protein